MTAPATTTATMTATQPHTTATTLANTADGLDAVRRTDFTLAHDGSYAARLARRSGDAWFPERWTLDGPEPYAVELPGHQPEEPDSDVLPLADGRVLIRRFIEGRHTFSLLYPTGPGTGEVPLGGVECERLTLLPPAPGSACAYALAPGEHATTVWLVAGGAFGPEYVTEVPGRCTGGVWLDRTGRMLALDRETDGVTKAVAVDLERGGEVTPLLQITDDSDDRLLLADADSGLLLVRSNAPGYDRLGWGVLGSRRPVRFPECLRLDDAVVSPFAVQPGQVLMPETCGVALRIDGAAGSWLGVWRPAARRLLQRAAPEGWLAGAGLWTAEGVLRLPCSTGPVPVSVVDIAPLGEVPCDLSIELSMGVGTEPAQVEVPGQEPCGPPDTPVVCKPVPLQQAPLNGRPQAG
ncbi:hypothetical protein OG709_09510 [Streptomyces sp. NBC_01267]|uniref:hypothetical protein n=1 Tax=unclassified Streptomyces TaxID=2593676 RepID=UPI0020251110|nr:MULTISPECIES: hypothetical protein [unclassified Streptomyces]MCX4551426.1 hypothetical protein [Streptomyces sp. NBC_01500]WSC22819.1 hypothetical protein OIE60_25870 [Streptomyces sp. NBC_01766]